MYLSKLFEIWKTLEMSLINCKINLILTLSANCVISNAAIKYTKFFVLVLILPIQENSKLFLQLKLEFNTKN